MNRRTFDLLVSVGGIALAILLVSVALVFRSNADFAKTNVRSQLTAQNITFKPAEALTPEERQQPGVVKYAGQQVVDGDMARVFADEYIALHLAASTGGKTYSELSAESRAEPENQELRAKVDTAFRGETLRGVLLTSYAFWTMGEKAEQTATLLLAGAAALLFLSVLGLIHFSRTPRREVLVLNGSGAKTEPPRRRAARAGA